MALFFKGISPGDKVTFNDPLDLLIYHTIEFPHRPALNFFYQKRAIIPDFTSFSRDLTTSPSPIIPKEEFFIPASRIGF
jgi:hypothetical protein